jgi:hypothetical protein
MVVDVGGPASDEVGLFHCPTGKRLLDLKPASADLPVIAHGLLTWISGGYVHVRAIRARRSVRFKVPRSPTDLGATSLLTRNRVFVGQALLAGRGGNTLRWRIYSYKLSRRMQRLESPRP